MKIKRLSAILISLAMVASSFAATVDEARRLYREGSYEAAVEQARALVKKSPRDGNGNFYLGA